MNKILFISGNQALKNLLTNQQKFEFIFINDHENLRQFYDDQKNTIKLLILDQEVSSATEIMDFAVSNNLAMISLSKNQSDLLPIKNLITLVKPIRILELLTIINQIITSQELKIIDYKNCQINFQTRIITKDQIEIKLTELETNLLKYIIEHEQNISKNGLLTEIWKLKNLENINDTGLVEAAFNKLRKKLKELGDNELINQIHLTPK